jgi:hypothetical protein
MKASSLQLNSKSCLEIATDYGAEGVIGIRRFQVQLLMGAPFVLKHLRNTKTPQRGFSPDKSLTNGVGILPTDQTNRGEDRGKRRSNERA